MKTYHLMTMLLGMLYLALVGCGGDSGGKATPVVATQPIVSGSASKGPIAGATVKVFQVISSATSNPRAGIPRVDDKVLAQTVTGEDGSYAVNVPAGLKGGIMVQITGGHYTDEATGNDTRIEDQFGPGGLHAIFANISGAAKRNERVQGTVSPFTEMAYRQAQASQLTDDNIRAANKKVEDSFGLPDIVRTKVEDATKTWPAGTSDDSKKYSLALAALSQYQKDFGTGLTQGQIQDDIKTQLDAGALSLRDQYEAAKINFADSTRNKNEDAKSPTLNPNAPASITATPAQATSVFIPSAQTITAQVKTADNLPVPDGTIVNFSTNFGQLSAASAATAGGSASVTLTSATVGSATVTITCGVSTQTGVISFADPDAPATIGVGAGAATGITNGSPVAITATLTRAAGGPVPNGTLVNFAIATGSGQLSAASAITTNGVASVNLTSAAAGASVTVVASAAGGVSGNVTVPFISQPTQAIVKVRTVGTLPPGTLIGGVNATVTYSTNKGLGILPANVIVSGAGTGSTMVPNTNSNGQVVLGLINVNGIQAGEFATLTFSILAGNFPTVNDFGVAAGSSVIDVGTQAIPGMSAEIAGVVIQ